MAFLDDEKAKDMAMHYGKKATGRDVQLVEKKMDSMRKGPLLEIWDKVQALWKRFNSPDTPTSVKMLCIGALLYMVSPFDLVPDALPIIGLLDDVSVIAFVFASAFGHKDYTAKRIPPEIGDIICKQSCGGLYQHYGIYIGEGKVINFKGAKGEETNPLSADIRESTMEDFLQGQELYIVRETASSKYKPYPPETIVERAKAQVGKHQGDYNLVFNNCEHFAYWCRYGIHRSRQVEGVSTALFAGIAHFI